MPTTAKTADMDQTQVLTGSLRHIESQMKVAIDGNVKLSTENESMHKRLNEMVEKFHEREKNLEGLLKQCSLEAQLASVQYEKSVLEHRDDIEKFDVERTKYVRQLDERRAQHQNQLKQEKELRQQVHYYAEKFEDFQSTLEKSNEVFASFRQQIDKMGKKVKQLEREKQNYQRKWEDATKGLAEAIGYSEKMEARNCRLEKLCRALQQERNDMTQRQRTDHVDPPRANNKPASASEKSCKKSGKVTSSSSDDTADKVHIGKPRSHQTHNENLASSSTVEMDKPTAGDNISKVIQIGNRRGSLGQEAMETVAASDNLAVKGKVSLSEIGPLPPCCQDKKAVTADPILSLNDGPKDRMIPVGHGSFEIAPGASEACDPPCDEVMGGPRRDIQAEASVVGEHISIMVTPQVDDEVSARHGTLDTWNQPQTIRRPTTALNQSKKTLCEPIFNDASDDSADKLRRDTPVVGLSAPNAVNRQPTSALAARKTVTPIQDAYEEDGDKSTTRRDTPVTGLSAPSATRRPTSALATRKSVVPPIEDSLEEDDENRQRSILQNNQLTAEGNGINHSTLGGNVSALDLPSEYIVDDIVARATESRIEGEDGDARWRTSEITEDLAGGNFSEVDLPRDCNVDDIVVQGTESCTEDDEDAITFKTTKIIEEDLARGNLSALNLSSDHHVDAIVVRAADNTTCSDGSPPHQRNTLLPGRSSDVVDNHDSMSRAIDEVLTKEAIRRSQSPPLVELQANAMVDDIEAKVERTVDCVEAQVLDEILEEISTASDESLTEPPQQQQRSSTLRSVTFEGVTPPQRNSVVNQHSGEDDMTSLQARYTFSQNEDNMTSSQWLSTFRQHESPQRSTSNGNDDIIASPQRRSTFSRNKDALPQHKSILNQNEDMTSPQRLSTFNQNDDMNSTQQSPTFNKPTDNVILLPQRLSTFNTDEDMNSTQQTPTFNKPTDDVMTSLQRDSIFDLISNDTLTATSSHRKTTLNKTADNIMTSFQQRQSIFNQSSDESVTSSQRNSTLKNTADNIMTSLQRDSMVNRTSDQTATSLQRRSTFHKVSDDHTSLQGIYSEKMSSESMISPPQSSIFNNATAVNGDTTSPRRGSIDIDAGVTSSRRSSLLSDAESVASQREESVQQLEQLEHQQREQLEQHNRRLEAQHKLEELQTEQRQQQERAGGEYDDDFDELSSVTDLPAKKTSVAQVTSISSINTADSVDELSDAQQAGVPDDFDF